MRFAHPHVDDRQKQSVAPTRRGTFESYPINKRDFLDRLAFGRKPASLRQPRGNGIDKRCVIEKVGHGRRAS